MLTAAFWNANVRDNSVELAPFFAAWTGYTPTVSQNGLRTVTVIDAKYLRVGKLVQGSVNLTVGNVGTAGNSITVTLPVSPRLTEQVIGSFWYDRASAAGRHSGTVVATSGAVYLLAGSVATSGNSLGTAPSFATAANDKLYFNFFYETA